MTATLAYSNLQGASYAASPADAYLMNSHGMINGETVNQWTEQWWTWALQSPYATSPQFDTTGQYAGVGNTNPSMFFVAGTFGSGDYTRTIDVPANEPLLVPIFNDAALQYSGHGRDPFTGGKGGGAQTEAQWLRDVSNVFLSINGQPVDNLQTDLVRTPWFSAGTVQPGSVAEAYGLAGAIAPSQAVGYWAVINGQPKGTTLTLDFGGSVTPLGPHPSPYPGGAVDVHIHDTIRFV